MRRVRCHAQQTVDAKGRIALPRPIRAALAEAGETELVLAFQKGAIWMWTREVFEQRIEGPMADADPFDEAVMAFAHAVLSTATDIEVDRQGRIRLPPNLREYAGIHREVVVHSIVDHVEIWDREAWESRFAEALQRHQASSGMPKGEA